MQQIINKKTMIKIIGREQEIKLLDSYFNSEISEFVVVYGRRRVGKTFLVRNCFNEQFTFNFTGLANANAMQQLTNFNIALNEQTQNGFPLVNAWLLAFQQLKDVVKKSKQKRKVIFIDELPWLDTPKSDFLMALEHFWNDFLSNRSDILLIVCGSSTSWIFNKLLNNHGGLHNRITKKIALVPFTLNETKAYLTSKNFGWNNTSITECYMVMGGIPFYLSLLEKSESWAQNMDRLCFAEQGMLKSEFDNLYHSLFKNADGHLQVVEVLSKKAKGLTRNEIIDVSKLPNGGGFTKILFELETCGFIRKNPDFLNRKKEVVFQLSDFYTYFYFTFFKKKTVTDPNYWTHQINSPSYRAWCGLAFERVCFAHIHQIKSKLGISGIFTNISSWRSRKIKNGSQIDLLIDRADNIINLCEIKFSLSTFSIEKNEAENLRQKISNFIIESKSKKSIQLTLITTHGLQQNSYSKELVQNELILDDLFTS